MKKRFDDYQWIAGTARTGSLWAGPDHLLCIETFGIFFTITERYRRIDYAKIQALSYGRTSAFAWGFVMWLVLLGLFTWWTYLAWDSPPGGYILGVIAVRMVIGLIMHFIKGPTVSFKVQTAVQVLRLKGIAREKQARSIIDRLQPLCRLHQGGEEWAPTAIDLVGAAGQGAASIAGRPVVKPPFTGSKLLTIALPLALLTGAGLIGELFVSHVAYMLSLLLVGSVAFALLLIGFGMASRMALPSTLKVALWSESVAMLLGAGVAFAVYMMSMMHGVEDAMKSRRDAPDDPFSMIFGWATSASFAELGWLAWAMLGAGALMIIFALLGLPSVLRPAHQAVAVAPPPPMPSPPKTSVPTEPAEDETFPMP